MGYSLNLLVGIRLERVAKIDAHKLKVTCNMFIFYKYRVSQRAAMYDIHCMLLTGAGECGQPREKKEIVHQLLQQIVFLQFVETDG